MDIIVSLPLSIQIFIAFGILFILMVSVSGIAWAYYLISTKICEYREWKARVNKMLESFEEKKDN